MRSPVSEAEAAVLALRTFYRIGKNVKASEITDEIVDLPGRIARGLGFEFAEDDPRAETVAKTALRGALAYLLGISTEEEASAICQASMETELRGYCLRGPIRRKGPG